MKEKKLTDIPVLVTLGNFVFPNVEVELEVGRAKSIAAINEAKQNGNSQMILLSQKDPKTENPKSSDIYHVGTLCDVTIKKVFPDDTLTVVFQGKERVKVTNLKEKTFYSGDAEIIEKEAINKEDEEELIQSIVNNLQYILDVHGSIPQGVISQITDGMEATEIIDKMAQFLPYLTIEKRQALLSEPNVKKRLDLLVKDISGQKQAGIIEKELTNKIKDRIDEQQKEYYLREKLRAIKEELGEIDGKSNELNRYLERLETEPFPENIKERIREEIARCDEMPQASSEANILRTYIDWMMNIPWYQKDSEENYDLKRVQAILDKYHYGLNKVKERIVEYLAVQKMSKALPGQIICLVGPPGVGKTSLAKSIAEAMDRSFVKVSLGGVKDESEIRGHRKTYIGAMPGRIIQGMKKAKVINPVFLLDEIDKMASDYRGDPSSAMLEVLDPEQNANFSDHYIEENYDLSKVMFIATANYIEGIPEPLKDRMEIIELSSYTELEKVEIAKQYLIPRVNEITGLNNKLIKYKTDAIEEIIKYYTRESGVRQVERLLNKISRKFIVQYLNKQISKLELTSENVKDYLGKQIFDYTKKEEASQVGVVTGLAYTQFGGDILPIEVNFFKGKGNLVLTGKLGDVMKESATIALDYIKANSGLFEIDPSVFATNDIHIHVPEGAVPKDGPSAGITLTTAIISALSHKPVSKDIGMTGEITLRGHVLPIGGLREKSISANRSGLKTILIPKQNLKDLDDIPEEVKKKLKILPVEFYREVYDIIFKQNKVRVKQDEAQPEAF
ncbi:endopeptidase La [Spiroplasma platyhelix]|uniref:Lon protease n=1 Tax=Spiroplasma platyhelix PALS-1 TaxID=1276218 RepID=A0A846TX54_9MOLU|nr:endopeptidase La [Spiroplasma platyhelix]MBE4704410.1 Lon protease 1 [Spiroplasma platyhelix PALS-1]NKE38782.1 endopeptidase La [Spiroplasma platyhelix PALS-1]UJB28993.1 class III heat-shock ATP-dependent LonA protease [Spiroplasma platyhelix PALS-1]